MTLNKTHRHICFQIHVNNNITQRSCIVKHLGKHKKIVRTGNATITDHRHPGRD